MTAKPNIERTNECKDCGTKEFLKFQRKTLEGEVKFSITCSKCGNIVEASDLTFERSRTKAIKAWNENIGIFKKDLTVEKQISQTKPIKKKSQPKSTKSESCDSSFDFQLNSAKVSIPKDKALSIARGLIKRFKNSHPKENCPVTIGDLLTLFGFSDEEIIKVFSYKKHSKIFVNSFEDMIDELNKGNSIYRTDKSGRTWKYSLISVLDEYNREELIHTLKNSGFSEKNTYILNNTSGEL